MTHLCHHAWLSPCPNGLDPPKKGDKTAPRIFGDNLSARVESRGAQRRWVWQEPGLQLLCDALKTKSKASTDGRLAGDPSVSAAWVWLLRKRNILARRTSEAHKRGNLEITSKNSTRMQSPSTPCNVWYIFLHWQLTAPMLVNMPVPAVVSWKSNKCLAWMDASKPCMRPDLRRPATPAKAYWNALSCRKGNQPWAPIAQRKSTLRGYAKL